MLVNSDAVRIPLRDESVHCVVTSPPYWGLRKYKGVDGSNWPEVTYIPMPGLPPITIPPMKAMLGLEPTPEAYVGHIVLIWREVWRVLRGDGVCWLDLGDCYSKGGGNQVEQTKKASYGLIGMRQKTPGFGSKQLVGIPWRVAFALQADGWYLRSDIIWAKGVSYGEHDTKCSHCGKKHTARYSGSCMPESVRDRPTKGHEYLFLLAKQKKYYYDKWAVVEGASDWGTRKRENFRDGTDDPLLLHHGLKNANSSKTGRNLRSVWTINPKPYKGAHFAVFPPDLVRPCILAGTSEVGVCPECGMEWKRIGKTNRTFESGSGRAGNLPSGKREGKLQGGGETVDVRRGPVTTYVTNDWQPQCNCTYYHGRDRISKFHSPIPATILDPFCGSGTTLLVARDLNRNAIGLDLSYSYLHDQATERLKC